jgi:hypothetical protein
MVAVLKTIAVVITNVIAADVTCRTVRPTERLVRGAVYRQSFSGFHPAAAHALLTCCSAPPATAATGR